MIFCNACIDYHFCIKIDIHVYIVCMRQLLINLREMFPYLHFEEAGQYGAKCLKEKVEHNETE